MTKATKLLIAAAAFAVIAMIGYLVLSPEEQAGDALPRPGESRQLVFYNWSDYYPPHLLKKFKAETGINVVLEEYDSNETLLAKLQGGPPAYDVVVPSDYMVKRMIKLDLLEKIDAHAMENFKHVASQHRSPEFDPRREYSAPYMWGTTGFSYDSRRVPDGKLDESWRPVFEPGPELRGQIAMLNDEVEVWNAAAYYLGIDKCTEEPEEADKIQEVLLKQKPHVATYNSDGSIERLRDRQVVVHMHWNGTSHRAKKEIPWLVYVYPAEGITFWNDNLVIPKGAKNVESAKIFINWMMKPENAAAASNFTGYMNSIVGSDQLMDPALRNNPAVLMPAEYASRLRPNRECSPASQELRKKVWARVRSG